MPIIGQRPESGVRIALERGPGEAPWRYVGAAHVPHASYALEVVVAADGEVDVALPVDAEGGSPPPDLAEKVRLIVRAAYRQARADGEPPARRIVRWRGEK